MCIFMRVVFYRTCVSMSLCVLLGGSCCIVAYVHSSCFTCMCMCMLLLLCVLLCVGYCLSCLYRGAVLHMPRCLCC